MPVAPAPATETRVDEGWARVVEAVRVLEGRPRSVRASWIFNRQMLGSDSRELHDQQGCTHRVHNPWVMPPRRKDLFLGLSVYVSQRVHPLCPFWSETLLKKLVETEYLQMMMTIRLDSALQTLIRY